MPIQIGENWFGPEEMFKALSAGACDLAMPDIMKIGGITRWLRASALVHQFGLPLSSHLFQELKNGHAVVPDLPGAGLVWRETQIDILASEG